MTAPTPIPTHRTPLETVLAYIECYNNSDSQGMYNLMAVDFHRVGGSTKWVHMGREMYRDMSERWNQGFDDNLWEMIDVVVAGSTVVAEFYESATFNHPWPITNTRVVQPNGKRYRARATVWFTVNGVGLIDTYRYYSDDGFGVAYGEAIAASGSGPLLTPIRPE